MYDKNSITGWLIIPILSIVFSSHSQYIIYQFFKTIYPDLQQYSYFRFLMLLYLIPFITSIFALIYPITLKMFDDINRSPLYLKMKQISILTLLSVLSVICDYIAFNSGNIQRFIQKGNSLEENIIVKSIDLNLSKIMMLKLILQPFFTIILGSLFFNRKWLWKSFGYIFIQTLGIFIYEFTILTKEKNENNENLSYKVIFEYSDDSRLKYIIPKAYYETEEFNLNHLSPFIYQWLPFMMIFISCLLNSITIIYSKSSMIYEGYKNKLEIYQKQKIKLLKDSQLNISYLDKDMKLKPRLINKQSMLYKRFEYLYDNTSQQAQILQKSTHNKNKNGYQLLKQQLDYSQLSDRQSKYIDQSERFEVKKELYKKGKTKYFYSSFKNSKFIPKIFTDVFQIGKQEQDPLSQEIVKYRDNKVLSTEEEDILFKLQQERDKQLGIKNTKLERLPSSNYTLQSYLQQIQQQQQSYQKFRNLLQNNVLKLRRLDPLDEMALDMNNILFHQHLFCEFNELEASKIDIWYNNQVFDILAPDFCNIIGLNNKQTWLLNMVTQSFLIFPLTIFCEFFIFSNQEEWITFYQNDWITLFDQYSWELIIVLLAFGILIVFRPIIQHQFITQQDYDSIRTITILQYIMIFIADILIKTDQNIFAPIMQIIGYIIVIYGYIGLFDNIKDDMQNQDKAQQIDIIRSKFCNKITKDDQKIENQLMFLNEEFDDITYQQIVQDLLLSSNPKSLSHLAPSCNSFRRLFDFDYKKTKLDWGGGYPRPQVEMTKSTWNANINHQIQLNPQTFVPLRPDNDMADLLQYKIRMNEIQRVQLHQKMLVMQQQKHMLEQTHKYIYQRVNMMEKGLYFDQNQNIQRNQTGPRILPPIDKQQLTQNITKQQQQDHQNLPKQVSQQQSQKNDNINQEIIRQKLQQKQEESRNSMAGKIQSILTHHNRDSIQSQNLKDQNQQDKQMKQLLSKIDNKTPHKYQQTYGNIDFQALKQSRESDNSCRSYNSQEGFLRTQKRQSFLDKYINANNHTKQKQNKDDKAKKQDIELKKIEEKQKSCMDKFPEMVNLKANYYKNSKDKKDNYAFQQSWISIKAHHYPQDKLQKLDFAYKSDDEETTDQIDNNRNTNKQKNKSHSQFKIDEKSKHNK